MFFWNDQKLPYERVSRKEAEVVHSGNEFTVYDVDGKLMVEIPQYYTNRDVQHLISASYKPTQIIELINEKRVVYMQSPLEIPEDASEKNALVLKARHESSGGNLVFAYDIDLFKADWAELFVEGIKNQEDGDGTTSIDIANFIRERFNITVDVENDVLDFYQYVVTMYELRQKDDCIPVLVNDDTQYAGEVDGIRIDSDWMMGNYVNIEVELYTTFRGVVRRESKWIKMFERQFEETTLNEAFIRPLTEESRIELAERSRKVLGSIKETGVSFVHFTGEALVPFFFGPYPEYVDDRIIVDPASLYTVNTSSYRDMTGTLGFEESNKININGKFDPNLPEEDLHMVFPYSFGYIFATKKWAIVNLSLTREIKFRSDAIDKLVLEQDKKDMLLALVTNNTAENNDIIDGKGGGVITLLHGAPGLGKTLAAEVIAEYTQKPLYKVSVGELGTTPDALEQRLSRILNIATRWGAVLLIDEADIFLEARTTNDIERNAMVAIFLRLLEYYEGVLFLTTNRVANFDEAFYSRIMLSFGFDQFQTDSRKKVWTNLLGNSNITVSADEMATLNGYDNINARQIKNAINGARALAAAAGEEVGIKHIKQLLDNTTEFLKAVGKK